MPNVEFSYGQRATIWERAVVDVPPDIMRQGQDVVLAWIEREGLGTHEDIETLEYDYHGTVGGSVEIYDFERALADLDVEETDDPGEDPPLEELLAQTAREGDEIRILQNGANNAAVRRGEIYHVRKVNDNGSITTVEGGWYLDCRYFQVLTPHTPMGEVEKWVDEVRAV